MALTARICLLALVLVLAPAAIEAAPMGEAAPAPMGEVAPMAAAGNPQDNALENLNLDNVENAAAP